MLCLRRLLRPLAPAACAGVDGRRCGGIAVDGAALVADAGDLRRGVSQAWSDFVHLQLHDGPIGAVLRLIRVLLEPALGDDAHALGQGLRAMLGEVVPCRTAHEQRRPILVLAGLLVIYARGVCDGEAGDLRALAGGPQFRICGEVADDGDDGLSDGHVRLPSRIRRVPGRAGWGPWPSTRISRGGIRPRGR